MYCMYHTCTVCTTHVLYVPHMYCMYHTCTLLLTCKEDRNCEAVATNPVTSILFAVGMMKKFTSDTSEEDPYSNGAMVMTMVAMHLEAKESSVHSLSLRGLPTCVPAMTCYSAQCMYACCVLYGSYYLFTVLNTSLTSQCHSKSPSNPLSTCGLWPVSHTHTHARAYTHTHTHTHTHTQCSMNDYTATGKKRNVCTQQMSWISTLQFAICLKRTVKSLAHINSTNSPIVFRNCMLSCCVLEQTCYFLNV